MKIKTLSRWETVIRVTNIDHEARWSEKQARPIKIFEEENMRNVWVSTLSCVKHLSSWIVVSFPDMGRVDGGGKNQYSYFGHIFEVLMRHPSTDFRTVARYLNPKSSPLPPQNNVGYRLWGLMNWCWVAELVLCAHIFFSQWSLKWRHQWWKRGY